MLRPTTFAAGLLMAAAFMPVHAEETLENTLAPAAEVRMPVVGSDQTMALADFRGRYIVLHFATTW